MTRLRFATVNLLAAQKDVASAKSYEEHGHAMEALANSATEFAAATEAGEKPCHIRLGPDTPIICGAEPDGTPLRKMSEVDPSELCRACWVKFPDALEADNLERLKKGSDTAATLWQMFSDDTEEFGDVAGLLLGLDALLHWPPEAKEVEDSLKECIAALQGKLAKRTFLPAMMPHIRAAGAATTWDEINNHWAAAMAEFTKATAP